MDENKRIPGKNNKFYSRLLICGLVNLGPLLTGSATLSACILASMPSIRLSKDILNYIN